MTRYYLASLLSIISLLSAGAAIALSFNNSEPKPDYEAMANCIAEYDYHHPNRNMMRNLVAALELCGE